MNRPLLLTPLLAVPLAVLLLAAGPGRAATPLGGLAVAGSPDGTRLVAGGDSCALYDLDPATLAVKRRVHFGRQVVDMVFSPDGKRIVVESVDAVRWVDAGTLEVVKTFDKAERLSVAGAAGLVAVRDTKGHAYRVLSMADGSETASLPYDRMKSVAAFGLSPDGAKLAVLFYRKQDPEEAKVERPDYPKDLQDAALNEYVQRHDGYAADYVVYEVATGKAVLEKKLWFAAPGGGNRLHWCGGVVHVVSYENQNARIDAAGEVAYFELGNSYNYAQAASADGSCLLSGGLRSGSRTTTADLKATTFRLDDIEGFPEYFKSFTFAGDGTGFAGTSSWRVVRIRPDGTIERAAPVF